jgi:chromosome partitioning protein
VDSAQWGNSPLLILKARPNLDIIPSDLSTEPAKRTLVGIHYRECILANALERKALEYDVIVIDCAPSLDVLHEAALFATDWLVVPSKLDFLAVDGVNEMLTHLLAFKRQSMKAPNLFGILPTFFERRTKETVVQLQALVDAFGPLVLPPVPVDTKLRECTSCGRTIWEYAPKSRSATGIDVGGGNYVGGYGDFVRRLKERLVLQDVVTLPRPSTGTANLGMRLAPSHRVGYA